MGFLDETKQSILTGQAVGAMLAIPALIVFFALKACGVDFTSAAEKECAAKHGIWLSREHKCVPGFSENGDGAQ
jgi:hypothetical protein